MRRKIWKKKKIKKEKLKVYVGYRLKDPRGETILSTYSTLEEAKAARDNMKAPDVEVSNPFIAKNKEEAKKLIVNFW